MRWIIVSDIHANRCALEAVINYARHLAGDDGQMRFFCLGDVLGYGAVGDGLECIKWLFSEPGLADNWIPGNHDEWVYRQQGSLPDPARVTLAAHRCLLQRTEWTVYWDWFTKKIEHITRRDDQRDEPNSLICRSDTTSGKTLFFTHGSVETEERRTRYLYPWEKEALVAARNYLNNNRKVSDWVLFNGHSHYQYFMEYRDGAFFPRSIKYGKAEKITGPSIINPGSVGAPRDGDRRAAFAVYDTTYDTITFHRVDYDLHKQVLKLKQDSAFRSKDHVLTEKERIFIREDLMNAWGVTREVFYERWSAGYGELIRRLKIGDGGGGLEYFSTIYRKPDWDLEAM